MSTRDSTFYITGGTLRHDAPSYVERRADRELFEGLLKGEFCYVLTSRQMGKSSLMVRTANKLREQNVAVVVLDLTAIGQNLTPEQWYHGLLVRAGRQLELEDRLDQFWDANPKVSPVQRFFSGIRDIVLTQREQPLIIFVDEIDTVRSLPFSTDEFFAAIRECHNRRTEDPEFNRLTFCLLGVATPSDLIRDTRITPFNIGRRIELHDFTRDEAAPLATGLRITGTRPSTLNAQQLLARIFHWTNGHPYLTQRLCQAVAQEGLAPDEACAELFFSPRARERDDNLIFVRERLLHSEVDRAGLLHLCEQVLAGKKVTDDETNPLVSILRLSGIIRPHNGALETRNRIYERAFDQNWIRTNMPDAERHRQREAFRRGVLRTSTAAAAVIAAFLGLSLFAFRQFGLAKSEARAARRNLYVADMNLAVQALEADNRAHALDLLKRHIPKPGQEDLRGFEWRYVWRQCDADQSFILYGHSNNVRYVFFSPDAARVVSRSMDDVVKVWDLRTRSQLCTLLNASALAGFTPDGTNIVVGQKDGRVLFCDVHNGQIIRSLQTDGLLVRLLADGQTVVTTSDKYMLKFWDSLTGKEKRTVTGKGGIWRMPDSESIDVTVRSDGKVALVRLRNPSDRFDFELWDTSLPRRLQLHRDVRNARNGDFSEDGRFAAVGTGTGAVWIWDLTSQNDPRTFMAGDATVWSVAFSPDGGRLATASSDQTIRVWDSANRTHLLTLRGHENGVQCVAFSADGTLLASGSRDETVRVWTLATPSPDDLLTNAFSGVVFSPGAELVAAEMRGDSVKIWHAATLQERMTVPIRAHPLGFSSDGKSLLLVDDSDFITLDLQTSDTSETTPIQGGLTNVDYLAFSPARRLLATRSKEIIRVHECSSGHELAMLPAPPGDPERLAFSRNGAILAIAGGDGTVTLWDAGQHRTLTSFFAHKYFASSLAFSPDGSCLASGGGDNMIRFWDVATGSLRGTLTGHRQFIAAMTFSPDGKRLASGGTDRRVKFWDVALQQEVGYIKVNTGANPNAFISELNFSPDGNTLVLRHGGIIEFWRAPSLEKIGSMRHTK